MNGLFPLVKHYFKRKTVPSRNQVRVTILMKISKIWLFNIEAISSSTTAASLLDSTVEANVKLKGVKMSIDLDMRM